MKFIIFIALNLLVQLSIAATSTIGKTAKVDVPGMVCQMCVQGMKKNFSSVVNNPDNDVVVDLDQKTVTVKFNTEVTEEIIKEKVQDAGYNAASILWIEEKKK